LFSSSNAYGDLNKEKTPSYTDITGNIKPTNVAELYSLFGLLIYMGVVQVPALQDYWSTSLLLHGLWARSFMGRQRFKALLSILHVDDPRTEEGSKFPFVVDYATMVICVLSERRHDKLYKVRTLVDHMQRTCQQLFQPALHLSLDERMVKAKGRFSFK
jgi:hypothetical protein